MIDKLKFCGFFFFASPTLLDHGYGAPIYCHVISKMNLFAPHGLFVKKSPNLFGFFKFFTQERQVQIANKPRFCASHREVDALSIVHNENLKPSSNKNCHCRSCTARR